MASGVRDTLAIDGRPADIGVATTGVAGPTPQDGKPVGTVFLGIAIGADAEAIALELTGDRAEIRAATVRAAVDAVLGRLGATDAE
jgi:nicotinamide-nucleotide amidase